MNERMNECQRVNRPTRRQQEVVEIAGALESDQAMLESQPCHILAV